MVSSHPLATPTKVPQDGIVEQRGQREGATLPQEDIAELRRRNASLEQQLDALRESELRYRTLVESAKDFIFIVGSDGMVEYVNAFGAAALNMSQDSVVGRPLASLFPSNADRQAESIARVLATGRPFYVETETAFPERCACLETWLIPIANQSGQYDRVIGVSRDITERKRALEQLHYRIAFEETIAAISRRFINVPACEIDAAITDALRQLGEFLEADCGSIRLTKDSIESFVWPVDGRESTGLPIALVSHRDTCDSKPRKEGVAPAKTATSTLVVPLVYAGATVGVLSFTAVPANTRWSAQTEFLLGVAGEIFTTALIRKRGEEERDRMASQLARVERLDSIGILAGGIAHDFNNFLAAVMGNVSLATSELESSGQSGPLLRLKEAERALERTRDLTRQLLTFAKGGSPVTSLVDLGKLVTDEATFVTRGSKLRPLFGIADDLWTVEADAGQIAQVIHNLVINAVQATPGGGTVDICAENVGIRTEGAEPLPVGDYVRVTVADHGIGIPAEHLSSLFVPYFTTKPDGTGLGLATSYNIVRRHGGMITVHSERDAGSRFHMYLPAATRVRTSVAPTARALERGEGVVLVVDDDEAVRTSTSAMLAHLGYQPITAESGEEALALYRRALDDGKRFHAIIMDLTMPGGMEGNETFQRIRAIDPDAAAIVSSGYSDAPIMADHTRHGYRGVLVKPYGLRGLAEALHGLLEE